MKLEWTSELILKIWNNLECTDTLVVGNKKEEKEWSFTCILMTFFIYTRTWTLRHVWCFLSCCLLCEDKKLRYQYKYLKADNFVRMRINHIFPKFKKICTFKNSISFHLSLFLCVCTEYNICLHFIQSTTVMAIYFSNQRKYFGQHWSLDIQGQLDFKFYHLY